MIFFKRSKNSEKEPKYETIEMLEEFVGEDGSGTDLIKNGKFVKAVNYYDKMIRKYPRSVYFKSHKAWALCGLGRFDEAIIYFNEVVEISDNWKNKYLPTFKDLTAVTCSVLLNKSLVMEKLNKPNEITRCYDKIIEISDFLQDLGDFNQGYYQALPYKARVHLRKGETQSLLRDISSFLAKCPPANMEWLRSIYG